jgi:TonB family protein
MESQTETANVNMLETLGLLPEPERRLSSFMESIALNFAIGLLLFWFAMAQLHKASPVSRYVNTELIFPIRLPHVARVRLPPARPLAPLLKIERPRPRPEVPQPETVRLKTAPMPQLPRAPATAVMAPPQPRLGAFVKSAVVESKHNPSLVKPGGFGDPSGVAPNANATRPATIAAYGSFDNAPGAGRGAGAAHASRGTAALAGFANGVVGGASAGTGAGRGAVATGGFGGNGIGGAVTSVAAIQQPHFIPPEVLFEPRPHYTEEARQLKIQGEITLQVRFGVDGKVEVLRVVSGLGHGLDEEATLAAGQIRFKPAVKDGQPTDHITYIHILFQLA